MYPHELPDQLREVVEYHNFVLTQWLKAAPVDYQQVLGEALSWGEFLKPMVDDVATILHDVRREGGNILFEGAQGALLDIDHGTYPYVTSSNTTVGGALAGTGVGAGDIDYVLGLQEASVIGMADGYAQATRNAGFVNLHSAAGVGHALGNVFTAYRNQTPLVITVAVAPRCSAPI